MEKQEFDLESASDNFYAEVPIFIKEAKELVDSLELTEEYKKIVFTEILKVILTEVRKYYFKKYKKI